jgi:predicted XRE-type DNA-binding protein
MLRNNVELDLKTKLIEDEMSQTEIADKLGVTVSYVNKITRCREHIVNRTFVAMMEQLGYDVRLVYEKRDET